MEKKIRSGVLYCDEACASEYFDGYVYTCDELIHHSFGKPDFESLLGKYNTNCGVFVVSTEIEGICHVFTDPMAQYPVFYYDVGGLVIVGTDIHAIQEQIDNVSLNRDVVYDYVSYLHPLGRETLVKGVKRLAPFERIEIENGILRIVKEEFPRIEKSYSELLSLLGERMRQRAGLLLEKHKPLCHLSGGLDSRLALAAIMSKGFRGPVFCYGDGSSEDRVISHSIAKRMGLSEGRKKLFHSPQKTIKGLYESLYPFNGMKVVSLANYGSAVDFSYCEVTGYFSEALLKGFSGDWLSEKVALFNRTRQISSLPSFVFDHAEDRAHEDLVPLLRLFDKNRMVANCLFYLQNRCAGHFGAHSALANKKFISIDVLYDPMLLNLIFESPYSYEVTSKGAIIVDLIRNLQGEDLAAFPYDGRRLPKFATWTKSIPNPSCFEPAEFKPIELDRLSVERFDNKASKEGPPISETTKIFSHILDDFPGLLSEKGRVRPNETSAINATLCLLSDFQ